MGLAEDRRTARRGRRAEAGPAPGTPAPPHPPSCPLALWDRPPSDRAAWAPGSAPGPLKAKPAINKQNKQATAAPLVPSAGRGVLWGEGGPPPPPGFARSREGVLPGDEAVRPAVPGVTAPARTPPCLVPGPGRRPVLTSGTTREPPRCHPCDLPPLQSPPRPALHCQPSPGPGPPFAARQLNHPTF